MQPARTPLQAPAARQREPWGRTAIWCRAALIFGWLAVLVLAVGYGDRPSSYSALESAIRAGKVNRVDIADEPTGPIRGSWTLEVTLSWRRGLIGHTTTVTETNSGASPRPRYGATAVIHGKVSSRLRAQGVDVHSRSTPSSSSSTGFLPGWTLPGWTLLPLLAVLFGTLVSIGASPEPWRATRWAWFWLVFLASPIGLIAYVLLSGPAPFVREPATNRRLTGGWALLLALVISAATATGIAAS